MTQRNPELATKTLELYGSLQRILLDEIVFQADRSKPAGKGQASVEASNEVGIKDTQDGYHVSVILAVQAISEETKTLMYSVRAKATAFYSVPEKFPKEMNDRVGDAANLRASLQVYPMLRRLVLDTVAGAGYSLQLPPEPVLAEAKGEDDATKKAVA